MTYRSRLVCRSDTRSCRPGSPRKSRDARTPAKAVVFNQRLLVGRTSGDGMDPWPSYGGQRGQVRELGQTRFYAGSSRNGAGETERKWGNETLMRSGLGLPAEAKWLFFCVSFFGPFFSSGNSDRSCVDVQTEGTNVVVSAQLLLPLFLLWPATAANGRLCNTLYTFQDA